MKEDLKISNFKKSIFIKLLENLQIILFFLFITGVLLFDRYFTHLFIKISGLNVYITEIFIIASLVISLAVLLIKKNTEIFKQFPQNTWMYFINS